MRKEWGMVSNLPITKRIFDEQIQRKPDNYPWAKHFIDTAWETFWTPDEFNFTSDYNDFKVNMTDEERQVLTRTLSAIQQIEVAVKTFWANLGDNLPHPSLRDLGYVMANQEVIHNNAYEKLLTVLGLEDTFEQNLSNPVIAGRVEYLRKYLKKVYENDKKQYVYAITLFTLFVENVSLFSQFFIILHMNRTRGILKDTAQQVKYTRNEEACFTSDAEIMTPNGWRKITDMKVGDTVYQYEIDGSITETKVLHTINKDYKGDIYKVIRRNSIAQVTPDHEMIYFNKNGEYVRKQVQDMKFHKQIHMPVRGFYNNTGISKLSPIEQLFIATQADGSKLNYITKDGITHQRGVNGGHNYIISVCKERKVDRLKSIFNQLDLKYSITKYQKNNNTYYNFQFHYDGEHDLKTFNWVNTSDKSFEWCSEFVNELLHWDGSISGNAKVFASTNKSVIDVVSHVGTLAGYRVASYKREDNRSVNFNDTWKLTFNEGTDRPKSHGVKTEIMQYDGIVTCVTVPSGNIIVRHPDHDAFIIGNCHAQVGIKIINTIKSEYPDLFDDELQQRITDECYEAIECETNVIKWMMGDYEVDGLNVDVLHNFIKKRMIESLDQIGIKHGMSYDKSFDKDITWMYEGMLGTNMVDFFASRPVDYARGKAVTVDDLF